MKTPDAKARIVMVTNYDQADLREAALQAGAYAFVAKDNLFRLVHLLEREQP
jgi:DNA-binding NarL/FixJ family response regulator